MITLGTIIFENAPDVAISLAGHGVNRITLTRELQCELINTTVIAELEGERKKLLIPGVEERKLSIRAFGFLFTFDVIVLEVTTTQRHTGFEKTTINGETLGPANFDDPFDKWEELVGLTPVEIQIVYRRLQ